MLADDFNTGLVDLSVQSFSLKKKTSWKVGYQFGGENISTKHVKSWINE